jgi:hypothetical protein
MSDFKFPCPGCGQSISCDTSNTGMQVACPACQKPLTVPQPPAAALAPVHQGLSIAASQARSHAAAEARSHAAPPSSTHWSASGTSAAPDLSAPKTAGLAIASLACSLSTLVLGIGFIPGIILGHMAKASIRRNPALKGMKLASAGLILGYVFLGLAIGITALWLNVFTAAFKQLQANSSTNSSAESAALTGEARRTNILWTLDLTKAHFATQPATGKIHGSDFTVEIATWEDGHVDLLQGSTSPADRGVIISPLLKKGETLEGKSYRITPSDTARSPQIQLFWKEAGQTLPQTQKFTNGYAMRLEFGTAANGKIPAKIYLCLPDEQKSCVGGIFEAVSKTKGSQPPVR